MPDHQGEVGRYSRTHLEVFVRLIIARDQVDRFNYRQDLYRQRAARRVEVRSLRQAGVDAVVQLP
jgi:hypothetical protein